MDSTYSTTNLLDAILCREGGGSALIERIGSPSRIGRASTTELTTRGGLSEDEAARIAAAMELGRRAVFPDEKSPKMSNPQEVADYFLPLIGNAPVETFCCALVDNRNQLIKHITVSTGTVNECHVHPREIFREAIIESARSIILAHNHPSGELTASTQDISLTARIIEVGRIVGIQVLDHVIVGKGLFTSLAGGLPYLFQEKERG